MNHGVIGLGEVGKALSSVLKEKFYVWEKDLEDVPPPDKKIDFLHVCLNFHAMGATKFAVTVGEYLRELNPSFLDVCSTVTPGTTEQFGPNAVHSTTRGLHPNLRSGLLAIAKHVGGPKADAVAKEYRKVGIRCVTHASSRSTEVAHILNNSAYGISLMFADEMAKLCREYGVDYFEAVMKYTATHNEGFAALDHPRLVRSILTPPNGRIGGHCVQQGATLIPENLRGKMLSMLADYNNYEKSVRAEENIKAAETALRFETVLPLDPQRSGQDVEQGGGDK